MNTASKIGKSFQKPNKHRLAAVRTFARLPALHVPPPFIRRCGEQKENSKFVIVFIRITLGTTVHEMRQFAILITRKIDSALHKRAVNEYWMFRQDDSIT
jgi:hypothetical protein